MSKAVCCDRCGKLEKIAIPLSSQKHFMEKGGQEWEEITTAYDYYRDEKKSFSLCPDCATKFWEFMGIPKPKHSWEKSASA